MRTLLVGWAFVARLAVALLCCALAPAAIAQVAPTINLSGLPSNTVPGQNLTVTATFSGSSGTPGGSTDIVVRNVGGGANIAGCGNLYVSAGSSSCYFTTPPNGNYQVDVVYSGDGTYAATTATFPFTTQQVTVSIALAGLPSNTRPVTTLTVTSNISSASPLGTPTGSVDIIVRNPSTNANLGGCGNLYVDASGNSSCYLATPSAFGNYQIEVNYSGDGPNAPATGVFPFTVSVSPVVTNTSDSGPGSLRDVIDSANANCSGQTITFDIPGAGVHTIQPTGALPLITCSHLSIDGYSQPGTSRNTLATGNNAVILIEINGQLSGYANGLVIQTDSVGIDGLAINGFAYGDGIQVIAGLGTPGFGLSGNFIGTDASGTIAKPNYVGVHTMPGATGFGACSDVSARRPLPRVAANMHRSGSTTKPTNAPGPPPAMRICATTLTISPNTTTAAMADLSRGLDTL